jgi:hypothetical protein
MKKHSRELLWRDTWEILRNGAIEITPFPCFFEQKRPFHRWVEKTFCKIRTFSEAGTRLRFQNYRKLSSLCA